MAHNARHRGRRSDSGKDLLRLLAWRMEFGPVYVAIGNRNRAAIIVVPLTGPKKLTWRYTYHPLTVTTQVSAGYLVATPLEEIPGGWHEMQLDRLTDPGEELKYWQLTMPVTEPAHG